ncbi:hypothetical protein M0802_003320 [Mischocyttarus mexicanus]|nr:hypothetical protein M0802_003320 [Mischocyttarus mexicanus]
MKKTGKTLVMPWFTMHWPVTLAEAGKVKSTDGVGRKRMEKEWEKREKSEVTEDRTQGRRVRCPWGTRQLQNCKN